MLDLVIRNGLIVDGSGLPGRRGDVSIRAAASSLSVAGGGEAGGLDATGKVVAPGFIDPHTHYDAQLCFDPYAFPAIEHGITTVVTGQLLALARAAPHRPARRIQPHVPLIEEMPEAAFEAGVDWRGGEGFGGVARRAGGRSIALNVAPSSATRCCACSRSSVRRRRSGGEPQQWPCADLLHSLPRGRRASPERAGLRRRQQVTSSGGSP